MRSRKRLGKSFPIGGLEGLLLLALALGGGCRKRPSQVTPWTGDLVMAVEAIEPLDPILPSHSFEIALLKSQVFETLVRLSPEGKVIPHLARRWEVTPDSMVYRFELRQDVFFHPSPVFPGGKTRFVTAGDVVFSLKRALSRKSFYYRYFDGVISGMRDFSDGRSQGKVEGIRTLGPFTLEIRLERPYPGFLRELANPVFAVVPRDPVLESGDEFGYRPVGTGPFRVARFSLDTLYLVRNGRYWGKPPRLPGIRAVVFDEPSQEQLALQSGMIDWGQYAPDLDQKGEFRALELRYPHHLLLWVFNPKKPFPQKTLSRAVDRTALVELLRMPGDSVVPVADPFGFTPLPEPLPLPSPHTFKIHLDPFPETVHAFERMAPLLKHMGLHLIPVRSFSDADLYLTTLDLSFDAPRALLLPFYSKTSDPANPWGIRTPRLDGLIETIPLSPEALGRCARALQEEAPAIFLLRLERRRILVRRRVHGFPRVLYPYTLLNTLWIEEAR